LEESCCLVVWIVVVGGASKMLALFCLFLSICFPTSFVSFQSRTDLLDAGSGWLCAQRCRRGIVYNISGLFVGLTLLALVLVL
jgi:hypothetical protein